VKCLVCDTERNGMGQACKMCGMHSKKPVTRGGFPFCCVKCFDHFDRIMKSSSQAERKALLEKETVI
jgi:hypothetical protein